MTNENLKRLISLNEACTRYGISRQTIYRAIGRGDVRLVKIGRASRLNVFDADVAFGLTQHRDAN